MKNDKTKKERAEKYEEKLHIDGTLDEVLKLTIPEPERPEKKE